MNAQTELNRFLVGKPDVLCLSFCQLQEDYNWGPEITGTLEEILPHLDFDYDSSFGTQELDGTIWFVDGSWVTRGEYDGSEWWDHHSPSAPPARFQGLMRPSPTY